MNKKTTNFIVNSVTMIDVPDTIIDQLSESAHPAGPGRWESIKYLCQEVGNVGTIKFQCLASIDNLTWDVIITMSAVDTAGNAENLTSGGAALEPGGKVYFTIDNEEDPELMTYRYFKLQASSPLGANPNLYGQSLVTVYAR